MKYFYYSGLVPLALILLFFIFFIDQLRISGCPPKESWFSFLSFLTPLLETNIGNILLNYLNALLVPLILLYVLISIPTIGWRWRKHKSFVLVKRQFILTILIIISIFIVWVMSNLSIGSGQLCSSSYPTTIKVIR